MITLPKVSWGNWSLWQLQGACYGMGARQGRLGLHKEMPYLEQWGWQQLKPARITSQPALEGGSCPVLVEYSSCPVLVELTVFPAHTAPQTLLTPDVWCVCLHTHRSLYFILCCCCSIFTSISLPCLSLQHDHYSTLPAQHCSPPVTRL